MFIKYPHLERFGTDLVDGIEIGTCYIFPKLDGTNASVWMEDGNLKAGSRNRQLDTVNPGNQDNAGFAQWVCSSGRERFEKYFSYYPHLRLYGEWLVPHSVKTYREDCWRDFYVFDVYDQQAEEFVPYEEYIQALAEIGINFIACQKVIKNPTLDALIHEVKTNTYLIREGEGIGEGVVVKQYGYKNKFGQTTWAKLISSSFKEQHMKAWKPTLLECEILESKLVDEYVTTHLVDKVVDKIRTQHGCFEAKNIGQLLGMVWHDLVSEELWEILKKYKNPKIDFTMLHKLTIKKIKDLRKELF